MRVKVCGMTKVEQVQQLNKLNIEFCGFIFYEKSKRYVLNHLSASSIKKIKGKINKVGVFVNANEDDILKTVDACGLYLVQLHGDETPKQCEKISSYITTIKAFRIGDDENVLWKIKDYADVCDMFLFDTKAADYGGTGKQFNWNILNELNIDKPFFLSGGIGPNDIEKLKEFSKNTVAKNLLAVDINSKFEISYGVKDINLIEKFVNSVKNI
ncbi:MAG: phosphoribosylanthranilate isomerase [Bacteroidetes bacterium]|nr:phosphoribosylanthranilate isomerase [Bacteroidota bacterium]MBS1649740.1 phosphoribosylanthranilate isomerase [Bacteroidota bacterium]